MQNMWRELRSGPNVPHTVVAIDGPAVVLDVFSPVREDYAELYNKYIPADD